MCENYKNAAQDIVNNSKASDDETEVAKRKETAKNIIQAAMKAIQMDMSRMFLSSLLIRLEGAISSQQGQQCLADLNQQLSAYY